VHPLYENDHIHNRLIHSIETAAIGRSLGISIGDWLEMDHGLGRGEKHVVAGIVQAACLAHDIGNPPFGHAGEAAIGDWFAERFRHGSELFSSIEGIARGEFEAFEGNAQGFRLITRLQMYRNDGGMRLSRGVLGAFSKYPSTARAREKAEVSYCGLKKFGLFESEVDLFAEVAEAVGLPVEGYDGARWWRRHPLVFLVEAADDICYNIIDLEDAFASGEFSFDVVMECLAPLAGAARRDLLDRSPDEIVAFARARSIGSAIEASVDTFKTNYESIMNGTFSTPLVQASAHSVAFDKIRELASQRLFRSHRKTELEVFGRSVLHRVLDGVVEVYEVLLRRGWKQNDLSDYHQQLCRGIGLDIRDVADSYSALRSLTDYVSGMTDRFAVKIAKMVLGA
jgi:dGTPase